MDTGLVLLVIIIIIFLLGYLIVRYIKRDKFSLPNDLRERRGSEPRSYH